MTIGERIKNRRVELGLSVDTIAAKLSKNRATIRYQNIFTGFTAWSATKRPCQRLYG